VSRPAIWKYRGGTVTSGWFGRYAKRFAARFDMKTRYCDSYAEATNWIDAQVEARELAKLLRAREQRK